MAERVAGRAEDHDRAVAEQIVVAVELQVVEVTRRPVEVAHDEHAAGPLALFWPPGLVPLLLLDGVDRLGEEFDIPDVVEVRVRGDGQLDLTRRNANLLQMTADDR